LDDSNKRSRIFGLSCGDAAPSFDGLRRRFQPNANLEELLIVRPLDSTALLWQDNGVYGLIFCLNKVSIACHSCILPANNPARVTHVIITLSGMSCAFTARCISVLGHLW
jgi:hypothetical protein